ncbi:hypothetical protein GGF31_007131 [Allomyces arbusculus]|nr:hypothetical protein GGF31_007131 [Allomyces arbusculus]
MASPPHDAPSPTAPTTSLVDAAVLESLHLSPADLHSAPASATPAATPTMPRDSLSSLNSSFANVSFGIASEPRADERTRLLYAHAANSTLANAHVRALATNPNDLLNPNDPKIKEDIIRMIIQYLSNNGYHAAKLTLQDEANVRHFEHQETQHELRRLRKAILDGDWAEVDRLLLAKPLHRHQKAFLYALYKQQYLETIEHHELHKAFTFLNKRLKPLEAYQTTPDEFRDLCYLLTAKSIHDAPSFRNWDGIGPGRERLVDQLQSMMDLDETGVLGTGGARDNVYVPPNRLVTLLQQAVAHQVEAARYHPKLTPRVGTLLEDYSTVVLPNATRHVLRGHSENVKKVAFVGDAGKWIASASSDHTARVWDTESGRGVAILAGHAARIWDVAANRAGTQVATVSGDASVRLWDLHRLHDGAGSTSADGTGNGAAVAESEPAETAVPCVSVLKNHAAGDLYTVQYHPGSAAHIATGGYDKQVRFTDVSSGQVVKSFAGHQLSVTSVAFSPMGNVIVSGSKDSTIRFWDVLSGLCVRTLTSHLGEVTGVALSPSGTYLLSASKDNSNRLWDTRMMPRPLRRFKGHTNTAKNFVRASFAGAGDGMLVVGGSEDGAVYVWDRDSGAVVQRLRGHAGIVYDVRWCQRQQLLVSCSEDATVRTWHYDENVPVCPDEGALTARW